MASFSVVTSVAASNAQANLYTTNIGLNKALTLVPSGSRINSSGDDAAGLAVANGYRSKVAILNQGIRNANDGLSTLQIQDGALDNISKLLDRLATLATRAASSSTQGATLKEPICNKPVKYLIEIIRNLRELPFEGSFCHAG